MLIRFFFVLAIMLSCVSEYTYSQACTISGGGGTISAGTSQTYSLDAGCNPCRNCNSPNFWFISWGGTGSITIGGTTYTTSPVSINGSSNLTVLYNLAGNYTISWEWGSSTCSPSCPGGGATFGPTVTVNCATPSACWNGTSICESAGLLNLNTLLCGSAATGGTWSGTGVTGNNFDPTGRGGQTIAITYSVGTAPCDDSETHNITVETPADACWNGTTLCENDPSFDLTTLLCGTATSGGSWSGTGITGNNFNPNGLGGQTIAVTYSVGTAPCDDSETHNIIVTEQPNSPNGSDNSFSSCITPYCVDLNAGRSCISGVLNWYTTPTPTAATTTIANPANECTSVNTTYYGFCYDASQTTNCQFSDSLETIITITTKPDPCWTSFGTICETNNFYGLNFQLCASSTTGGIWSGPGVTGNSFNPVGLGGQTIALTYTVGTPPCDTLETHNITIVNTPSTPTGGNSSITNCGIECINLNQGHTCATGNLNWYTTPNPNSATVPVASSNNICPNANITYYGFCYENTNPNNCQFSDSIETVITILPESDPCWLAPDTICENNGLINLSSLLCATATTGGSWSGPGIFGSNFSPIGRAGQNVYITYTVGTPPCDTSYTDTITVLPVTDACFNPVSPLCESDPPINLNTWLCASATSGGTWSGTGVTGNSFDPTGLGGQIVNITYTVGVSPCVSTETHPIQVSIQPDPCWNPIGTICQSEAPVNLNTLLCPTGVSGGTWSGTGVTGNTFDPAGLGGSTIPITYTVGPPHCNNSETHNFTIANKPTTPAGGDYDLTICGSGCINLNQGRSCSQGSLQWYNISNPTLATAPVVTPTNICPNSDITYYGFCVSSTNPTDCQFSDWVETRVTVIPKSDPCWNSPAIICDNGGLINLNDWLCASSTLGGEWSGQGITGNTLDPLLFGDQAISITYKVGTYPCDTFQTQDVIISRSDPSFETSNFCFGEYNQVMVTGVQRGIFTLHNVITGSPIIDNNTGVISNASLNAIYTIQYKTYTPCVDSSSIDVRVLDCDSLAPILFVPNSFTPDSDGFNDKFIPVAENLEDYTLYIFNRWGQLLFETNQLHEGWDGMYNGMKCPIDSYVWRITYKEFNSAIITSKFGHVNIIR